MNHAGCPGCRGLVGFTSATSKPQAVDTLTLCILSYLAIPNLIFIFGWFRLPLALALCGAMIYFLIKYIPTARNDVAFPAPRRYFIGVFATALAWAAFGGGSHFVYANPDWVIRDAVLGDLIHSAWPVLYQTTNGDDLLLRSAIGYFLPLALFGKFFGVEHLDIAIFLWTTSGVLLFLLALPLSKRNGWILSIGLMLVVFFSGMDFVGQVIATESLPLFPLRLEWWVPLSYPSLTNQLLWAPNHCLPIWVATALVIRHRDTLEMPALATAILPLTLIWTPFAAMGLAPFVLLGTVRCIRRFGWISVPWKQIAAAVAFSFPMGLYLTVDVLGIDAAMATTEVDQQVNYALRPASLRLYFLFITCEFLFLALVLAPHVKQARAFFYLAVLVLVLLPIVRIGPSNDFILRLSTPPLVVLLIVTLQTLLAPWSHTGRSTLWFAWLFLAIGAHTAFNELWRSGSYHAWKANYSRSLSNLQGGRPAEHYAGVLDSSLVRFLLKPRPHRN